MDSGRGFDLLRLTESLIEKDSPLSEELEKTKKELKRYKQDITLIVDDDPTNRVVMKTILEMQGKKVMVAKNGLEAVELYKKYESINLIYMDIMMPVMNGIEATKEIRLYENENRRPRSSIIAVTAHSDSVKECTEAGIDRVIIKPIIPDNL